MSATSRRLLAAFFCLICAGGNYCQPSNAQGIEPTNYEAYSDLRTALLGDGWKPDSSNGLKDNRGRALYRFPEVLCGPKICNAKWRDNKGKVTSFTLMRGESGEEYRVLPQ